MSSPNIQVIHQHLDCQDPFLLIPTLNQDTLLRLDLILNRAIHLHQDSVPIRHQVVQLILRHNTV